MKNRSPAVDAYIAKSPAYAKPILKRIRSLFHKACPQIEETVKWGCPCFERQGIVAGMAAFKNYATLGFWKQKLLSDPHKLFDESDTSSMFHARFTHASELPASDILVEYIREAVTLNEQGVKLPPRKKKPLPELQIPDYFVLALKKNKRALATFEGFSPSNKRDYVEWIIEAKREETRAQRLATAIEWMSQGKPRNWKYMKGC